MNYIAMIQNRKSVRAFRSTPVAAETRSAIQNYYNAGCQRLLPEIQTELVVLDTGAREALEGAAGYEDFLVGAPTYLLLLTEPHAHAGENAGYIMEDMVLKLTELGLDSCWVSFADGKKVMDALNLNSTMELAAIVAFGYGEKTAKKLRLNIRSMSNVDVTAQRHYYSPKKDVYELVSVDKLGSSQGLDELMGFYEDMLWQSFYAASLSPSYLNRQPYAFVVKDNKLVLVQLADQYTDACSAALNLGIVLLHFSAVAAQWVGKVQWKLDASADLELPEGSRVAAVYDL